MIKLKFPDLKFIKSHPLHPNPKDKEDFQTYEWTIFTIDDGIAYCRIVYNEEDNGKIYLDLMLEGYCDRWVPEGFGIAYPATIQGYKELQKIANKAVNDIVEGISFSNKLFSEGWEYENE